MRRSTKVGVALGVAAVAGLVVARRGRKPRRPPVKRTLLALALVSARAWWNPASWWNTVAHLGDNVAHDIESWVKDFVNLCFSIYDEAAQLALDLIDGLINLVGYVAGVAYSWAGDALGDITNIVDNWIPSIVNSIWSTVWGWVVDAANAAASALDDVYGWAVAAFDAVDGVINSIWDNYLLPALDWISHAADWFGDQFAGWWNEFWAVAIAPVLDTLSDLGGWIEVAGNFLYGDVTTAVHAVEAAWDWIVWFGEHTFDELDQLFTEGMPDITEAWILSVFNDLSEGDSKIESVLEQVFGS